MCETYVGLKLNQATLESLSGIQKMLGLKNPLSKRDFHMTLMYSKKNFDHEYKPSPDTHSFIGNAKVRFFGEERNVVVLELEGFDSLIQRHEELKAMGGEYGWDEYRPHITLSYDEDTSYIEEGKQFVVQIETDQEYHERLQEDW